MSGSTVRILAPMVRRSMVVSHVTQNSLRGGASPPLPPFQRLPVPSQKLVENHDAVWDDGVAPEVGLDFDCQHISKNEGIMWWLGGLGFFTGVFQLIKFSDPEGKNPAVNRRMNIVVDNPRTGPPLSSE
mmetsp:Transcript_4511/g.4278  ORF Transcript_4511/g.4278 Transcript_4511/m.4278 type:complete len:129 (-) Transcript_4511:256-642(-)|eukprot:CAMPEP_0197832520 /NCGR_PEP_ID=MMETSP1437-20131217/15197_1 /TAXON_ID=49252 ORGANISM="Eucampia antarctica, Strain CCMP1452" /NCGR_SAMPLE_ID=MMETSP1437 /ASSEMBLY_ACC=CAM_ASM_001096 /LENGTH=128 /DNA_ID=CAMNT_0043435945 /DNA_START=51 /DNA_END=437 /DNA_ORIENTATION=+